ncbi:MAG: ABC transporter permease [Phycisphaerae bacterium]|nr:ABC transporter permease [Phycisphaerae bacterium]
MSPLGRLRGIVGPLIGFALLFAFVAWSDPSALSALVAPGNVRTVLVQYAGLMIAVVGMTLVIVSGGIDLSVGSVAALSSVVTALALSRGASPTVAALAGIATGVTFGCLNGLIVTRWRIAPFIATLGTMGIARGLGKWLAQDQTVRVPDEQLGWLDALTTANPQPAWLVLAPSVWIAFLVAIVGAVVLRHTVFGVHVTAIGSSETTARLCGVRVERTKWIVYALSGLCAGIAGTILFARLTVGDPTAAIGFELQVVAAVVIGGASLAGGEGSIGGALCGALLLGFLVQGCNLLGIKNSAQEMLTGVIVVLAVTIDAWRSRR